MQTELAAQRLHRRLEAEPEPDAGSGDDDRAADTALTRWLPEPEPGGASGWLSTVRADPGRAGVAALAVVGVVAVLVTVFALVRDNTPAVASAKLPPVEAISSPSPAPVADAPVVVSVVGLVHKPGLVTLDAGARIADALQAAGGPLDGADVVGLNMARRVADGEQIVVGIAAAPGEPVTMGSSVGGGAPASASPAAPPTAGADAGPTGSVNLNTATAEELDTLPGIGPVTAAAIIAWRDANGSFASVEQLADVDGIGPARLEKLRNLVHV